MNTKLQTAVAALVATVDQEKVELSTLRTFVTSQPDVIANAVKDALAAHDVDEDEAADTIEAARADAKAAVDDALSALPQSTVTGGAGDDTISGGNDTLTLSGGQGDDTVSGGQGSDTVTDTGGSTTVDGGAGNDTITGGNGNDTLGDNTGGTVVTGDPGAPSTTIDPNPASIPPAVPPGAN